MRGSTAELRKMATLSTMRLSVAHRMTLDFSAGSWVGKREGYTSFISQPCCDEKTVNTLSLILQRGITNSSCDE